jgi:hypothetical protein
MVHDTSKCINVKIGQHFQQDQLRARMLDYNRAEVQRVSSRTSIQTLTQHVKTEIYRTSVAATQGNRV